jgi:hypothetical protein
MVRVVTTGLATVKQKMCEGVDWNLVAYNKDE